MYARTYKTVGHSFIDFLTLSSYLKAVLSPFPCKCAYVSDFPLESKQVSRNTAKLLFSLYGQNIALLVCMSSNTIIFLKVGKAVFIKFGKSHYVSV